MIRKVVLAMFVSVTLGGGLLSIASLMWSIRFEPIDSSTAWLRVGFDDGRCTAYYAAYNYDGQHPGLQQSLRSSGHLQYWMLRNNIMIRMNVSAKDIRTFAGGFKFVSPPPGRVSRFQFVAFPMWAPLSILGIYPTLAFIRGPLLRWRRRRKGLCLKCGYDLTGNESGVCPECGEGE